MLKSALILAERGMAVFPCRPRDKRPACKHGCRDATRDSQKIKQWWNDNPDYNVSIACGPESGVFVLDIDGGVGEAWLHKLETNNDELPPTVTTITSRGRHLFFRWPVSKEIRNSAGLLADGVDVRGLNGYVLCAPSVHPSGYVYRWGGGKAVAEPPEWLLQILIARARSDYVPGSTAWRDCEQIPEGKRNSTLASLAGHLIRCRVDVHTVRRIVELWNDRYCVPPLDPDEAANIVASVARTHLRNYPHA